MILRRPIWSSTKNAHSASRWSTSACSPLRRRDSRQDQLPTMPSSCSAILECEDPSQRDRLSRKISEQHRQMHTGSIDGRGWPTGYCVNTTLAPQSEGRIAWGLAADCSEEFWFKNLDELTSFRQHCAADPTLLSLSDCQIASCIEVITNEVVLPDVPGQTLAGDRQ